VTPDLTGSIGLPRPEYFHDFQYKMLNLLPLTKYA
jgi:hypothetical protein